MNVATAASDGDSGSEFFKPGDRVRLRTGAFENYDGIVKEAFPESDLVRISISVFGRRTIVEVSSEEVWGLEDPE